MLFLSKLLAAFAFPLGFALVAMVGSILLRRARGLALVLGLLGTAILWVASTPIFSGWLASGLEVPPASLKDLPSGDVGVVLGGILGQPVPPRTEPDLGDPVDRIIEAWRLYKLGKVEVILVSGGNIPWETATAPESVLIKQFLVELGVPEDRVLTESESRNTRENALNTAAIVKEKGWRSVLLVTSAAHMRRAEAAFARAGLSVIPVATDVHALGERSLSLFDFLPDAESLGRTTSVAKEWLGLIYYRAMGWA